MPRFYFHLFDGDPCVDEEGLELDSLAAARRSAVNAARSILAHDLLKGEMPRRGSISIADASGEIMDWVTFDDILEDAAPKRGASATRVANAPVAMPETSATRGNSLGVLQEWSLRNLLLSAPLGGVAALAVALLAVILPTLVRWSVDSAVSGTAFSPYLPFVLLSALLIPPKAAVAVAIASAVVADFFFMEPYFSLGAGPDNLFGVAVFLVTSAIAIFAVRSVRQMFQERPLQPSLV